MSSAKGRKVGTLGTQARHKRHRAAQQEIHVHHRWHGVTAEDVSAILARVNHDGRGRVD